MYYTHKNLRVGLGAFNPFTDNYKQQTENWNKYASYKKTNYVKGELAKCFWQVFLIISRLAVSLKQANGG